MFSSSHLISEGETEAVGLNYLPKLIELLKSGARFPTGAFSGQGPGAGPLGSAASRDSASGKRNQAAMMNAVSCTTTGAQPTLVEWDGI